MDLGELPPSIKNVREAVGMEPIMLAAKAGVSLLTIQRLESGKTYSPTYETMIRIADALEFSDRDLWAGQVVEFHRLKGETDGQQQLTTDS